MTESPIEKLMFCAGRCDTFSSFYQAIAIDMGIISAEHSVSAEFTNLNAFYDWVRARPSLHKEESTFIVVHPQVLELRQTCATLRASLEGALCELQELVMIIIPNLKALYRSLVRRLHPDLNPGQGAKEKSLWLKLQSAYKDGDIEEMRLVEVLMEECTDRDLLPLRSGIDEWASMKSTLEGKLCHTGNEIAVVKSNFPYSIREKIENDQWAEEENSQTRQRIREELALKKSIATQLENLRRLLPHD